MYRKLLAVLVLSVLLISGFGATRTGAWVDEIIVTMEPNAEAAITRMEAGDFHIYAMSLSDPNLFKKVRQSAKLDYVLSSGSYNELTFNPYGPTFNDGRLNPFSNPKIREAMNWLIDRNYIISEIYGGLGTPRWLPINTASGDYVEFIDTAKSLEFKYTYDFARAEKVISEELQKMGAKKEGGVWTYNGKPIEIILLIRIEDERKVIGDYVADQLQKLGFKVDRQYKRSADASPIWYRGDPAEGKFHIYTAGWITTVVPRQLDDNFDFFYTKRGLTSPLWQAYKPSKELDETAEKLAYKKFENLEERAKLYEKALELSLQDSVRLWLIDQQSFTPIVKGVEVAYDLYGGISGSYLWPLTIRLADKVGGTIKIGIPSALTEPWNPIGGSNWIYDTMLVRATGVPVVMPDPYTGLRHPVALDKVEVTVNSKLPVKKTLDWVTLKKVDKIVVPQDAFIDWDPVKQQFITVKDKMKGKELTAEAKVVVTFPKDLFKRKFHDGSTFDMADLLFPMILTFDRANPKSKYYDESAVPSFEAWIETFKGFKVASWKDQVVIEYYTDVWYMDAELIAADGAGSFWPAYGYGYAPWSMIAIGLYAEEKGWAAFTADKSESKKVEWLNYVAGPSLKILNDSLNNVLKEGYLPYYNTLRPYLTRDQMINKLKSLQNWYKQKGHFWVGFGPFYLEKAYPTEKVVHLKRFEGYPDPADRWEIFGKPAIPKVGIEGAPAITVGNSATFNVSVTYAGKPYVNKNLEGVKYLLFAADGTLVSKGDAKAVKDGSYTFEIPANVTKDLKAGTYKVQVIVSSKLVALPGTAELDVVVRSK